MAYPEPLEQLIEAFERFPGVGRRTAERLAFHALRDPRARELSGVLERAVRDTRLCRECSNVTLDDPCALCDDPQRDAGTICVVEQPADLLAIEKTDHSRGHYNILNAIHHHRIEYPEVRSATNEMFKNGNPDRQSANQSADTARRYAGKGARRIRRLGQS